eukprot:768320-Hanusia_phi.AAC.15
MLVLTCYTELGQKVYNDSIAMIAAAGLPCVTSLPGCLPGWVRGSFEPESLSPPGTESGLTDTIRCRSATVPDGASGPAGPGPVVTLSLSHTARPGLLGLSDGPIPAWPGGPRNFGGTETGNWAAQAMAGAGRRGGKEERRGAEGGRERRIDEKKLA